MIDTAHHKNKGFTLIEIMVVVSIIVSLSSIVLVGIKAAQASGNDSVRQSSALQVRNALALYATDHGGVPSGAGVAGCVPKVVDGVTSYVCSNSTGLSSGTTLETGVLKPLVDGGYISHIPIDMINTNGLEYTYVTSSSTGVTPGANGTSVAVTPTASFDYVSELHSLDPLSSPVVITTPVGQENYTTYANSGGYPPSTLVSAVSVSSFTGPGSLTVNTAGTWTVNVSNPTGLSFNYVIDWGDGSHYNTNFTGSSLVVSHTYTSIGSYTVNSTVTGTGLGSSNSLSVYVLTPAVDPVSTSPIYIWNSGSINTAGFDLTVNMDGSGTYNYTSKVASTKQIPAGVFDYLASQKVILSVPSLSFTSTNCVKSKSFGTTETLTYNKQVSGDLTCPPDLLEYTNLVNMVNTLLNQAQAY